VRNVLIAKYRQGTIGNLIDLRKVAKIARAEKVNADPEVARAALTELFTTNNYSVEQAYQRSVAVAYSERDVITRANSLNEMLSEMDRDDIDDDAAEALRRLCENITALLKVNE
jgi:hypothetical protein